VVKNELSETSKNLSRSSQYKRPDPQQVNAPVLKKSSHEKLRTRPIERGYESEKLPSKYTRKEADHKTSIRHNEKEPGSSGEQKTGRQTPGEYSLALSAPKVLYSAKHRDSDRHVTAADRVLQKLGPHTRNERLKESQRISPTNSSSSSGSNDLIHAQTHSSDGELMLLTRVDVEKEQTKPASELLLFTPVGSSKGQLMKVEHVRKHSDHSEGQLVRIKPVNVDRAHETKYRATSGPAKTEHHPKEKDQQEEQTKKKASSKHKEHHITNNKQHGMPPSIPIQQQQPKKQEPVPVPQPVPVPVLLESDNNTSAAHVAAAAGSEAATHAAAMAAAGTHQVQQVENSAGHVVLVRQVQNMMIRDPYGDEGRYTGVVMEGRPHGRGTMHYIDGRSYAGDWKHGRWCGQGRATFVNGDVYVGQYERDQRHGYGRYEWADGRIYDGGFRRDNRNGSGTYSWPDGSLYTGEFLNGHRHGQGTYQFADGSIYTGEWKNGKYHGQGECVWADGRTYRGDWQEGKAHGYGVEHRPDGSIRHEGEWKKDRPVRPKLEP
jgi:hypothetical protein